MLHTEGYVTHKSENGIATIEFFHPSSNSLPSTILELLANTIKEVGSNEHVKVIVLRSGGEKAFCAGASFDELMSINNEEEGKKFFKRW